MSATIRDAKLEDLPPIDAIYRPEVLHGVATFDTEPRSEAETRAWFERIRSRELPVRVAIDREERVIGYSCLAPWSPKPAYSITAESSVYVHTDHRSAGIGRALVTDLIEWARERSLQLLVAQIETSGGAASRRLHTSLGFEPVGVLHGVGQKFGRLLDVEILELRLSHP